METCHLTTEDIPGPVWVLICNKQASNEILAQSRLYQPFAVCRTEAALPFGDSAAQGRLPRADNSAANFSDIFDLEQDGRCPMLRFPRTIYFNMETGQRTLLPGP